MKKLLVITLILIIGLSLTVGVYYLISDSYTGIIQILHLILSALYGWHIDTFYNYLMRLTKTKTA